MQFHRVVKSAQHTDDPIVDDRVEHQMSRTPNDPIGCPRALTAAAEMPGP